MEHSVIDFFQLNESSDMTVASTNNKPPYVSLIKVRGKPILPPLINDDKRKEMQSYKQKAIEMERRLAKQKRKMNKISQSTGDIAPISHISSSQQSTPARPATLNLSEKRPLKAFILAKSKTEGCLDKYSRVSGDLMTSQRSAFRSTLEQKLASEDSILIKNKLNIYQQSPIIEEQYLEKLADSDSEKESRWSPLKIDSINALKIELPTKNNAEFLDENQNTPETVTESPSLMRQNSYTLLTPSPALLNFLESQKEMESKPQSGRKTWDLSKAKSDWNPNEGSVRKSSDEESDRAFNKKNNSSLDSFSTFNHDSMLNSMEYDSGTSPESASANSVPKIKKVRKKVRSIKSLPSPIDKVPKASSQSKPRDIMPEEVKNELSDLSNLLLKMKVDHERQKKELEEKQQSEMKKLEIIFQRREAELLNKVNQLPKKLSKSIYSQNSLESPFREPEPKIIGDGIHNRPEKENQSIEEHNISQYQSRRPQSAKDFHSQYCENESRRARSMDFNQNQDTDLDVSFQDDFMQSKDTTLNNEYIIESDSISNFSSHSSTVSSENKHDLPVCSLKKFQGITSEDFAKINQAATIITAAARGFLTRRLLRTAHVQGLIVTLKDAITCATQLHTASDIADSDIDLMRRLGRQIEAAWDAVYSVFFNTEISTRLQLIAADRERLKAVTSKTPATAVKKKRISSATKKSLDRKKGGSVMSKSQTSNGFTRVRACTKMTASYPSPYFSQKFK